MWAAGLCGVLAAGEMTYRYGLLTGRPHARTDVDDVIGEVFDRVEHLEDWETGPTNGYGPIDELTGAIDSYYGTVCSPREDTPDPNLLIGQVGSAQKLQNAAMACKTRGGTGTVLEDGVWVGDGEEPEQVGWTIRGGRAETAQSARIAVTGDSFRIETSPTGFGDKGATAACNSVDGSDFDCGVDQRGKNWRVKLSHAAGMRLVAWLRSEVVSRLRSMRDALDLSSN